MSDAENETQEAILLTLSQIPHGNVSSYGKIASKAGMTGRARYVGYLLKNLPPNSTIPWHRVLKSSGQLAFPEGDQRFERQKQLLEAENIPVIGGKVAMKRFEWT